MSIFDRLKQAISDLDEDELVLSVKRSPKEIHEIVPEPKAAWIEQPIEIDNLPFKPIRKAPQQSIFSKTLNLEKTKKEPPKIEQSIENEESKTIDSFQDIRSILKIVAKDLKILDQLPNDREAKILAKLYENKSHYPECLILYEKTHKRGLPLLQALSKAIEKRFVSCGLLSIEEIEEKENLEEILKEKKIKLFIFSNQILWHRPKLLSHYLEIPGHALKRLATKDLFVLSDLDYYLKDPLLKRSLWNHLMAYFKNS